MSNKVYAKSLFVIWIVGLVVTGLILTEVLAQESGKIQIEKLKNELKKQGKEITPIPTITRPTTTEEPFIWLTNKGWWPFGEIKQKFQVGESNLLILSGKTDGAMGITKPAAIGPTKEHNVLIVRVTNTHTSKFNDSDKMLKVIIGNGDEPLLCKTEGDRCPTDQEFVLQRGGDFFYEIPEKFLAGRQKLGLVFWKAELNDLQIRVALTNIQTMEKSIGSTPPPKATSEGKPLIEITEIPPKGEYPKKVTISGKVGGISNVDEYRVVIYSETDRWYVQPYEAEPLTIIGSDGKWGATIFLGYKYGALLVRSSYKPETKISTLPEKGGDVIAVTTVSGRDSD